MVFKLRVTRSPARILVPVLVLVLVLVLLLMLLLYQPKQLIAERLGVLGTEWRAFRSIARSLTIRQTSRKTPSTTNVRGLIEHSIAWYEYDDRRWGAECERGMCMCVCMCVRTGMHVCACNVEPIESGFIRRGLYVPS